MGWGKMFLLGNIGQQMDIEEQREEIESLREQINSQNNSRYSSSLEERVDQLQKENDELRLYLTALINYLGRQGVVQSTDFRKLVDIIDAEDGSTDGSYRGKILK